jgi:hypothetical protein
LFVEDAVPARVKRQLNMAMTEFTEEAMLIAFVTVLATEEVKANATFPKECVRRLELVIDRRGRRVAAMLVFSNVLRLQRLRTDVPPIETPMAFPATVRSTRSNSTRPIFVTITGSTDTLEFCPISMFVR